MLNSIKAKVNNIADIQNCGEEDCYPWKKEECRGCANRRVSVKSVLRVIEEAKNETCEWKVYGKYGWVIIPPHKEGFARNRDDVEKRPYCAVCGKRIEILEVDNETDI